MNRSIPIPRLVESNSTDTEANLVFGPYAPGYSITMGTCIRRVLLSSMPAPGITSIMIEGVNNKFAVIPGMKEELINVIENLKQVRFKFLLPGVDRAVLKLNVTKPGIVTSQMIDTNGESVQVLNDVYLFTYNAPDAKTKFKCEIFLQEGTGYVDASPMAAEVVGPEAILINNSLNAVKKVALDVEQVRYGEHTDYEVLKMHIKTDGSISPLEALNKAALMINEHLTVFVHKKSDIELSIGGQGSQNPNMMKSVKEIGMSEKTVLALQQFGVSTVGDLTKCTESYLLSIPRLGTRKIEDIKEALATMGLSLKDVTIVKNKEDM